MTGPCGDPTRPADRQRRRLLQAAGAGIVLANAAPIVFASGDTGSVAGTRGGAVRGLREHGVHVFKGIRYGADTASTRFQAPRAAGKIVSIWSGV